MKKTGLAALGLSVIMSGSLLCVPVMADESTGADTAQASLDEVNASIAVYEQQRDNLLDQIDDLESQLVTTISSVDHINEQLDKVTNDLADTEAKLAVAEKKQDTEKEAMKARIQYYYESGGAPGWVTALIEDGDIQAALSATMEQDLYDYDRQQLQNYADAVNEVKTLKTQQQDQKAQLTDKKNSLSESQNQLQTLLDQARSKYSAEDYDAKIQDAYAKAAEYSNIIEKYNDAINEQLALQTTATSDGNVDTSTPEAQSTINQVASQLAKQTGISTSQAQAAAKQAYQQSGTIGNGSTASGQALLNYAKQFLGGKYVYGGNSLTSGVDCSGFVQQVYKNFGIDTTRTSYSIATQGQEVSYADAQVGDVFVYDGHVGIYAGNGQMINAVNEATGIAYTNVNYDRIQTIRRFLPTESSSGSSSASTDTSAASTPAVGADASAASTSASADASAASTSASADASAASTSTTSASAQ